MKKIKYLLYFAIIIFIGVHSVYAAGSINVKANTSSVTVGNSVKVTVTVNSSDAAGWEYCLNYDTSMLSLTSPSNPCVLGGTLAGNKSVTFVLKARASGKSTISLSSVSVLDDAANDVSVTKGSVTITARTQQEIEASYSDNANLSNLEVEGYALLEQFNKDKLEYNLEVENEVEEISIRATRADSRASVSGAGTVSLTEGVNSFKIVVTAEKGNKKTYTLNINRRELNPINVTIENKSYTIVRKIEAMEAPTYYSSNTIFIQGEEVPVFTSEITKYTLVGLKDELGEIELYSYKDGEYKIYRQIGNDGFVFIPENSNELVKGYDKKKDVQINGISFEVYDNTEENNDDFVLIYGMNASVGECGWYSYDIKEGTFQRYNELTKSNNSLELDKWILILFGGGLGLSVLIIVILLIVNSKNVKTNKKLVDYIERKIAEKDKSKSKPDDKEKIKDKESKKSEVVEKEKVDKEKNEKPEKNETIDKSVKENKKTSRIDSNKDIFDETTENDILGDTDILEEITEKDIEDTEDNTSKRRSTRRKSK